jgi:N-acetyl-gamma-glutamyl-phosphate reductase
VINIGVVGATGYVGIEIVRLLSAHPKFNITSVVSQSFVGQKISDVYPNLRNIFDMECTGLDIQNITRDTDLFVTALPHSVSSKLIPELLKTGARVIDHSGDFRYKSVDVYEKWYKIKHQAPELLEISVYGLPELYRDSIREASLVANPGCYPTCSILGMAPLLKNGAVDCDSIIIDAVSGISGAGRKTELPYQYCEAAENFRAYNVSTHRHTSEIEQELGLLAGRDLKVSFTPHITPMKRGMYCTIYGKLEKEFATCDLIELYREFYKDEYFIRILDEGKLPETINVSGSNFIDIGLVVDKRLKRVIVMSAVDNLGKGAASQAIQDLNIMCGIEESTGLKAPGLYL